jgi:hypothetical protein
MSFIISGMSQHPTGILSTKQTNKQTNKKLNQRRAVTRGARFLLPMNYAHDLAQQEGKAGPTDQGEGIPSVLVVLVAGQTG